MEETNEPTPASEASDAEPEKKPSSLRSPQAMLRIAGMIGALAYGSTLLFADVGAKASGAGQGFEDEEDAELQPLSFDHEAARKLAEEVARTPAAALVEASVDAPLRAERDAAVEREPERALLPPDDAPTPVIGGAPEQRQLTAESKSELELQQQKLMIAHMLKLEQQQLELRERAMVAPSTMKEFREAQRAQAAADQHMLEGLVGAAGDGDEEQAAYQGVSRSLRALVSSRGAGGGGSMAMLGAAAGGVGASGSDGDLAGLESDPGGARAKSAFFQNGGQQLQPGELEQRVRHASSPYELQMGAVIPCELVTGISSQAPGQIVARVTEDVYDSVSHNHLLLPQGTLAVGVSNVQVSQGQTRVQSAWVRLNMPNGDKLDLGGMSGADQQGLAGFEDRVNRHIAQQLATALMTSAFSVAFELSAPQNGSFYGSAVQRGIGENLVQLGTNLARQQSQIPPTLEIRPGYQFNIMVQKDLRFEGPYRGAGRGRTWERGRP